MYFLPSDMEALPPMPNDDGHWSAWVVPTTSFLEFVMFSRMFVDSLDALHSNSIEVNMCLLGSSDLEVYLIMDRKNNVSVGYWNFWSMSGLTIVGGGWSTLSHALVCSKSNIQLNNEKNLWGRYFNLTLLKSMDEDLAEAADDDDGPRKMWLWPLTGEVHWQGIYEGEGRKIQGEDGQKEENKGKLLERMRNGNRQRPLGL
ncbi:uncharacterized protein LOC111310372 [Durio zibethinus]|uniref:Uncharacterized protein LOC111310372 n=1 Tax=Durio zibethinus TaxID=66656 RepID=A0A6P6AL14_DURZI|nr:uncharacterized protein LOC111310372 [Durio zibethinus]